jgi:hypothetical protein
MAFFVALGGFALINLHYAAGYYPRPINDRW